MKTQLNAGLLAIKVNGTNLHLMVNRLILGSMQASVRNDSFIMNDVPAGIFIQAKPDLSLTLHHLFHTMIAKAKNQQIIVSVKMKGNAVLIQMENISISTSGKPLQKQAEEQPIVITYSNYFQNSERFARRAV
jgi:hypothetical protein